MIDKIYLSDLLPTLSELLPLLRANQVRHIKLDGLKISFHVEPVTQTVPLAPDTSTEIIADTLKKQEEAMPVDLRADSLMDEDKILNWSSPDQPVDQPELPLTGEGAL